MATALRAPIRVGDLTPETTPVLVLMRDGEEMTLRGYVSGRRCPGRVKSAAAAAVRTYREQTPDGFSYEAFLAQIRELLLAVVIGLEDGEADTLAADDDDTAGGLSVLRMLGWWDDGTRTDEDDADPEAPALSSIGPSSSQVSAPSTTSGQPSS